MKSIKVDDANGRYYILRDGTVISFCHQQPAILIPLDNGNGYKYVKIGGKNYYIHKLVADAFLIYDKEENTVIHHLDLNRNNNHIENLLPLSVEEHALIHKLWRKLNADNNKQQED